MDGNIALQAIFIAVLLSINAFFAASEIAVISVNENKVKKLAENGNREAEKLLKLLKEPSKLLATTQVGITLAGFFASAAASESFSVYFENFLKYLGITLPENIIKSISLIIIIIALSYLTLVLGELVPKRMAMQRAEQISMLTIVPLDIIAKIASPFIRLLTVSTNFIITLLGGKPYDNDKKITEEEIRMMVDVGKEKGIICQTEKEMINNIFEFDNTQISEIMTHRTDIISLPINGSLDEVLKLVISQQYSRIPVYKENIDNIVGILFAKDLIQLLVPKLEQEFELSKIVKKPYFVPASKKTDELFKELQTSKNHMAIAIDEYGGTAGLVTIEDLLEEIVGNIFDEYDEIEKEIEKIDENTYMVSGTTSIKDIMEYFDVKLPTDICETLGGFIVGQMGRIPAPDEKPILEYGKLVFKVEEVDEKRVSKVKISKS
jgi:putative hemolysin